MGSPGYGAQLHVSIGGNKLSLYSNVLSLFHWTNERKKITFRKSKIQIL